MNYEAASYPVRFSARYPEQLNKLLNLPFFIGTAIKLILCIPFLIFLAIMVPGGGGGVGGGGGGSVDALEVIGGIISVIVIILWLVGPTVAVFTGSYPRGLWDFLVGVQRVQGRTHGYIAALNDRYPPFALREMETDEAFLEIDYPESWNKLLNFPIVGQIIKVILLIPQFIILIFATLISILLLFIGQFAILFTGRFPESMWSFIAGTIQLELRAGAYVWGFTDRYPPFSLTPSQPPERGMAAGAVIAN